MIVIRIIRIVIRFVGLSVKSVSKICVDKFLRTFWEVSRGRTRSNQILVSSASGARYCCNFVVL